MNKQQPQLDPELEEHLKQVGLNEKFNKYIDDMEQLHLASEQEMDRLHDIIEGKEQRIAFLEDQLEKLKNDKS